MARLPTFFKDTKNTYALFPGAPARGLSQELCGAWTMSTQTIPINMRWAVFQHACIVLCSHQEPQAWVGVCSKEKIAFGGPARLQAHMRMILEGLSLAPIRWTWRWDPMALTIPEDASWFSPGLVS